MKKNGKMKLAILIGLFIVLLGGVAGIIWKFNKPVSEEPKVEEEVKAETYLLFSFESYKDITGTKIRFMNSFGATAVNTDKKFVTEGDASWLIQPEGSYAKPNDYPSVQFNCVGSTFKANNFEEFDTVLMDVYNDSDEEVTLRWSFTMNNALGGTAEAQQEFVLTPKEWTTCVFDLTGEEFTYLYLKDYVAYMNLTVLRIKENREDTVPNIYVDNVRGHYTDAEYTSSSLDFNLREGINFEKSSDRYIFRETSKDDPETYMPISRVAYADTNVKPLDETLGEYALKGVATGRPYPGFTINFDKMYGDGNTLRFMMYVEVDPAKAEGVIFKSEAWGSVPYPGYPGDYKANEWVEVHIPMTEFGESLYVFVNLAATIDGKVHSKFGDDTEVNIYFDNFLIEDTQGMSHKQEDGSYKLSNPYGMNYVTLDILGEDYGGFKKGDYLAFDYELNVDASITMWVLGDEKWGPGYETIPAIKGNKRQTIKIYCLQDWKYMQVYIRFNGEGPFDNYEATISNICVFRESDRGFSKYDFTKGISFESKGEQDVLLDKTIETYNNEETYMPLTRVKYADTGLQAPDASSGEYVMAGDATGRNYPAFTALFDKVYGEGKTLQFKMYVKADAEKVAGKTFKVEGKNSGTFFTGYPGSMKANEWIDVSIPITTDISQLYFFLNLHDNGNEAENYRLFGQTPVTVYFDDFKITDTVEDVKRTEDGSIIITNPYGANYATIDLMGKDYGGFEAGDVFSFDFTLNEKELITMWILGNGKWGEGYETVPMHMYEMEGTKNIEITLTQDWEFLNVFILYRGEDDHSNLVATLSNIGVKEIMDENGNVVLKNPNGAQEVAVTLHGKDFGGFMADSTLNFDLTMNEKAIISVYVLGNGKWGPTTETKIEDFKEVNGTIATGVKFDKNWDFVVINIIYEGKVDYGKYVATLSNIRVESAMKEDGSFELKNPTNSSFVYATLRGDNYGNFNKGETLTFTLDMNVEENISMWVLGNGSWSAANKMKVLSDEVVNGKRTITVKLAKDYDFVAIYIQYLGDGNYSDHIATLKDFTVK